MKIILVGYGNVGKELRRVLGERGISTNFIVRSTGIYGAGDLKMDERKNFPAYVDEQSAVFIAMPSRGNGDEVAPYYAAGLDKKCLVITCEKAYLANHWEFIKRHEGKTGYSATVGGNAGILNAIADFKSEIVEIRAVVNGTLNYVIEKLARGDNKNEVCAEAVAAGFAEPGASGFDELIALELQDVLYKTAILANHSHLYEKTIRPVDIRIQPFKKNAQCAVVLTRQGIRAGFLELDDTAWFPAGANNVLYINNEKIVEGPGAGAAPTAERMFKDYQDLIDKQKSPTVR